MPSPTFSVVIPAFNRAGTIHKTLEFVARQTFTDFECLVVDDGSADGQQLEELVKSLRDRRFRYRRRPNGGGGAARNTGMDHARGRWIAFLDSDDIWLPDKLAADHTCLAEGAVLFAPVTIMRDGEAVDQKPARCPRKGENVSEYLTCGQGWTQTSTMVVPASVRSRFSEWARFGQDTDFALRLADEGLRFHMHSKSHVHFIDDEGSRVSRNPDWRRLDAWLQSVSGLMTDRAVLAYRAQQVARIAAADGKVGFAVATYCRALVRGALPPGLAIKALVQILVSRQVYRRIQRAMRGFRSGAGRAACSMVLIEPISHATWDAK